MSAPVPVALVIGQLTRGGAERQLHYLARGLDRRRFRPVVYCLSGELEPYRGRLEADGVPVVPFRRHGPLDVRRALALGRRFRADGVRLLHAFLLDASVYAAAARGLARSPVLIASNRVALPRTDRLRRALDRWALRRSQRILVNSQALLEFTRREYGVEAGRLRLVYNGLDPGPFEAAARKPEVRRALGAGAHDLLVAAVGRMVPQKNPGLFAAVAARVRAAEPRARFAWIGGGAPLPAVRREMEPMVTLAGERDDIPEVLKALDLLLLTSEAEGLPNVVLEAMAAGVPVVATDAVGVAEALGDAGLLRPRGDAEGLAEAALGLLRDPVARGRAAEAGRARVRREFGVEAMVRRTEALYDEALSDARTPA